jgi:hypothetical protein
MSEPGTKGVPMQELMRRDLAAWLAAKVAIAKAMRRV